MRVPFTIGHYQGRSKAIASSRLVNMFTEIGPIGEESKFILSACPGLKLWADTGKGREIRGIYRSSPSPELLYVASHDKLYQYEADKTKTEIGTLETLSGRVSMADNGSELILVDGENGYIYDWNSEEFNRITDRDFPGGHHVIFQDGYFIVSPADTAQMNVCRLYDGTSWDALDFASAEGNPDNTVNIETDHRELWNFGERSTSVWINVGAADFPFQRIQGSFIEKGCAAKDSVAKIDNSVFWLSHEGQVVRATGYSPQIVSTRQMDYQIANYGTIKDAFAIAYTFEGHAWYQLTFPAEGKTWVLDLATTLWHTRSSWDDAHPGQEWRHRANCYALFDRKHLVGDYRNGLIYELTSKHHTDYLNPIYKEFTISTIHADKKPITHTSLELEMQYGEGAYGDYMTDTEGKYVLDTNNQFMVVADNETGTSPNVYATVDYSDDDGWTWIGQRMTKIGQLGDYLFRPVLHKLGQARQRIYRIRCSDPVELSMSGAYLEGKADRG